MDESIPNMACIPSGYSVLRKDRSDEFKQKYGKNRGGGVAIYYKQGMKVEKKEHLIDNTEEIFWVQVKAKESFLLGVVYRAESTEMMNGEECKLEENIRKASEITDRVIMTGDYNIDMQDKTNKLTQEIKEMHKAYGLTQHVKKPTRIDNITGVPTLIDHIWSSTEKNLIRETGTFIGISDHLGVYMRLNLQNKPTMKETIRCRSYKNYDAESYNAELDCRIRSSDIMEHINRKDVNAATEELVKCMQKAAELHAPIKEIKIGNRKENRVPWFTDELKDKIREKKELLMDSHTYGGTSFKEGFATVMVLAYKCFLVTEEYQLSFYC